MLPVALSASLYQLVERIAVGGAGEVWRAEDLLGRRVAVKLLRAEYAEDPEALARFRREAAHAGSLSHPAIAAVHDYGEGGPACPPYLVMELVDGPSLAAVLAKGPLDAFRAMDVIAQVAAGLHAVHPAGLVHGDVKPANLLLDRQGHVKITDFGIARTAAAAVAGTGLIAGTPPTWHPNAWPARRPRPPATCMRSGSSPTNA
jgi:eukaryotic-like serine/threonine-protein kinase